MAVGERGENDGNGEKMKYEVTVKRDHSSGNLHTGINMHCCMCPVTFYNYQNVVIALASLRLLNNNNNDQIISCQISKKSINVSFHQTHVKSKRCPAKLASP